MVYARIPSVLVVGVLVACAAEDRPEQTSSTNPGTLTVGPTTDPLPTSTDPETSIDAGPDDDDDDETGDKLDVGAGTGMMTAGDDVTGCTKVDLIFVVDGSGSMADEQNNLLSAFPGFIDTMRTQLADADSYNVGVIRTDGNDISCVPGRQGVLVTRNFAAGSSMATCTPYASGLRFMTQADDLSEKFACAARVGIGGDGDEAPLGSLIAALTPPNTDAGECNEGFLRDDALLVVVSITDEEDDHETEDEACGNEPGMGSPGEPEDWFEAIVAAKGGVEQNIVVLSLIGPSVDPCPELDKCNGGIDGAEPSVRIANFTWMFSHGHVGPVCGDYDPFFAEAVADIQTACDEFIPPG
jgi:hypothetical protein